MISWSPCSPSGRECGLSSRVIFPFIGVNYWCCVFHLPQTRARLGLTFQIKAQLRSVVKRNDLAITRRYPRYPRFTGLLSFWVLTFWFYWDPCMYAFSRFRFVVMAPGSLNSIIDGIYTLGRRPMTAHQVANQRSFVGFLICHSSAACAAIPGASWLLPRSAATLSSTWSDSSWQGALIPHEI